VPCQFRAVAAEPQRLEQPFVPTAVRSPNNVADRLGGHPGRSANPGLPAHRLALADLTTGDPGGRPYTVLGLAAGAAGGLAAPALVAEGVSCLSAPTRNGFGTHSVIHRRREAPSSPSCVATTNPGVPGARMDHRLKAFTQEAAGSSSSWWPSTTSPGRCTSR
jgi:hypothetical protein